MRVAWNRPTTALPDTMQPERPPAADQSRQLPAAAVPHRIQRRRLLQTRTNFFGKLAEFVYKPVKAQGRDATYEELACLGFARDPGRLQAIVNLRQPIGYSGAGRSSVEYVRFFVEHADGWGDLGVAAFAVEDPVASPLPLSCAASVAFDGRHGWRFAANSANVRAILSWELEPPAGDPDFVPPWGNVAEARVQVAAAPFYKVPDRAPFAPERNFLDPEAACGIDPAEDRPAEGARALGCAEPTPAYLDDLLSTRGSDLAGARRPWHAPAFVSPTAGRVGPPAVPIARQRTGGAAGDTSYEELVCAGYDPQTHEFAAVVLIKRNAGYSGGTCTGGSREYVGFYALLEGVWHSVGTASFAIHDFAVGPGKPLAYGLRCKASTPGAFGREPTNVALRAILSWQDAPDGADFVPVRGEVVDTHVRM